MVGPAGTVAAPTYAVGNANDGIYNAGAHNVGIVSNGALLLQISSSFILANAPYCDFGTGNNCFTLASGLISTTGSGNPAFQANSYQSKTNCSGVGTAANPSVASCTSAVFGSVSCSTASGGNCQVNTTAVSASSQILVTQTANTTTGTRLGVTCNTTRSTLTPIVTASTAGTSFTFTITAPTTNPACFDYLVFN